MAHYWGCIFSLGFGSEGGREGGMAGDLEFDTPVVLMKSGDRLMDSTS